MNKTQFFIIVAIVLILAGGGAYFLQKKDIVKTVEPGKVSFEKARQETEVKQAQSRKEVFENLSDKAADIEVNLADKKLAKEFEVILSTLIQKVNNDAAIYLKTREPLPGLIDAANINSPEDVMKNLEEMQSITRELQAESRQILAYFDQADARVEALVSGKSEEEQAQIQEQWQALLKEHAGSYLTYFRSEDDIIGAYERLMNFYALKKEAVNYEASKEEITFDERGNANLARKLMLQVNRRERAQASLLKISQMPTVTPAEPAAPVTPDVAPPEVAQPAATPQGDAPVTAPAENAPPEAPEQMPQTDAAADMSQPATDVSAPEDTMPEDTMDEAQQAPQADAAQSVSVPEVVPVDGAAPAEVTPPAEGEAAPQSSAVSSEEEAPSPAAAAE